MSSKMFLHDFTSWACHPSMVEKRGITPLADKQEEEDTSGHKKNLEEVESHEDVTGFDLPLLATVPSGFPFFWLFSWPLLLFERVSCGPGWLQWFESDARPIPQVSGIWLLDLWLVAIWGRIRRCGLIRGSMPLGAMLWDFKKTHSIPSVLSVSSLPFKVWPLSFCPFLCHHQSATMDANSQNEALNTCWTLTKELSGPLWLAGVPHTYVENTAMPISVTHCHHCLMTKLRQSLKIRLVWTHGSRKQRLWAGRACGPLYKFPSIPSYINSKHPHPPSQGPLLPPESASPLLLKEISVRSRPTAFLCCLRNLTWTLRNLRPK